MPLQIQIPDEEVRYLSKQAQDELVVSIENYSQELLNEASRLEADIRDHQGDPEITRVMVEDAAIHLRRYSTKSKKSWGFTVIQVVSAITTLFAGGFFDIDQLQQEIGRLVGFLVLLTIAIIFTTLEIILGRTK